MSDPAVGIPVAIAAGEAAEHAVAEVVGAAELAPEETPTPAEHAAAEVAIIEAQSDREVAAIEAQGEAAATVVAIEAAARTEGLDEWQRATEARLSTQEAISAQVLEQLSSIRQRLEPAEPPTPAVIVEEPAAQVDPAAVEGGPEESPAAPAPRRRARWIYR